jgi:hypothetical protein
MISVTGYIIGTIVSLLILVGLVLLSLLLTVPVHQAL